MQTGSFRKLKRRFHTGLGLKASGDGLQERYGALIPSRTDRKVLRDEILGQNHSGNKQDAMPWLSLN